MPDRSQLLTVLVDTLLRLLTLAGLLVICGFFDGALGWNLFPPGLERVLYGLFFSIIAVGGFIGAAAFILALYETSRISRAALLGAAAAPSERERRHFVRRFTCVFAGTLCLICACGSGYNHWRAEQRRANFRTIAQKQFENFRDKLTTAVAALPAPLHGNVPRDIYDILNSLEQFNGVRVVTLYVPDSAEKNAMWGYTSWRYYYDVTDGFAKFYAVRRFEELMRDSFSGNGEALKQLNSSTETAWYAELRKEEAKPLAIIRLDAKPEWYKEGWVSDEDF